MNRSRATRPGGSWRMSRSCQSYCAKLDSGSVRRPDDRAKPKKIGGADRCCMILMSIITCPHCGHAAVERMPSNVCQVFYDCRGCVAA
jgi:hypothetical protein